MTVGPIGRRALLGVLGGAVTACAREKMPAPLQRLTGSSESPTSDGKMLARYTKRDLDPKAMQKEQDKVLRYQRAESFFGLVHAPEFEGYVNGVMRKLLAKAPVADLPGRVMLVTSRDWSANSTPPGLVFVPMGLVEGLDDEDQLAFVLGHELSHVLFRHHDSDWLVRGQKNAIAVGELALTARQALQGPRGGQDGGLSGTSLLAAQTVLIASDKVLAPAWNKSQESQADLLGIDLMIAAGYNPGGATEVLEKLAQWRKDAGQPYVEGAERLARDLAAVGPTSRGGSRPSGGSSGSGGLGAMTSETQRLWASMLGSLQGWLQGVVHPYPEPSERLELAQQYLYREYRDAPSRDAAARPFKDARGRAQARDVFTHYAAAFDARARLRDGNVRAAEAKALEAIQGFAASHNFPRYALAEVYARSGRRDQVGENLALAVEAPEPALESTLRLAEFQARGRGAPAALGTLEAARPRFADHPKLWPPLIAAYKRVGRTGDAQALQLRCQVEFPDFKDLCAGASRG